MTDASLRGPKRPQEFLLRLTFIIRYSLSFECRHTRKGWAMESHAFCPTQSTYFGRYTHNIIAECLNISLDPTDKGNLLLYTISVCGPKLIVTPWKSSWPIGTVVMKCSSHSFPSCLLVDIEMDSYWIDIRNMLSECVSCPLVHDQDCKTT